MGTYKMTAKAVGALFLAGMVVGIAGNMNVTSTEKITRCYPSFL
jgi:hypothetical protein